MQSKQAAESGDDMLSYKPYITAHASYMWLGFGLLKLLSVVIPAVSMMPLESVTTSITAASQDVKNVGMYRERDLCTFNKLRCITYVLMMNALPNKKRPINHDLAFSPWNFLPPGHIP